MSLGEKIKYYRTKFNYTQDYLGEYFHYTRQTISKWEQNKSTPSLDDIKRLAELFNVSIAELLDEEEKPNKDKKRNKLLPFIYVMLGAIVTLVIIIICIKVIPTPTSLGLENYDSGFYITTDENKHIDYNGDYSVLDDELYYVIRKGYARSNFLNEEMASVYDRTFYLDTLNHIYYVYLIEYNLDLKIYTVSFKAILNNNDSYTAFLVGNNIELKAIYGINNINIKTYVGIDPLTEYSINNIDDNIIYLDGSMALLEVHLKNNTIENKNITDSGYIPYVYFKDSLIATNLIKVIFK